MNDRAKAAAAATVLGLVVAGAVSALALGLGPGVVPGTAESGVGAGADGADTIQFREVGADAGLNYSATNIRIPTGPAGVYVVDFDRDGRPDLLTLGGSARHGRFGSTMGAHPALYHNTGDGFELSGALPRLNLGTTMGALFFDYDNDGWDDLLLLPRFAEPVFLENREGRFVRRDVGFDAELRAPTGATAADYDGDGCLDVFVIQNGDWKERAPAAMNSFGTENATRPDNGGPNRLFEGNCSSFTEVTDRAGIEGERWSLATSFVDLTGDDRPDIHVANDYNNDYVYVNEGDGTFEQIELGAATDRNGMSSELLDVDGDGRLDVFVTNIYYNLSALSEARARSIKRRIGGERIHGNNLLVNRGNGTFVDRAREYGLAAGGWGWAAVGTDFDNDGRVELYQNTERLDVYADDRADEPFYAYPVYWDRTAGGFQRRSSAAVGFEPVDSRGAAGLDYNRDGRPDIAVAPYTQLEYLLYENAGGGGDTANANANHWIDLRIESAPGGTAVGAEVYVTVDGETRRRVNTVRSDFLSQDSRVIHVGLGPSETVDRLRIVWPDGTERSFEDVPADRRLRVSPDGIEPVGGGDGGLLGAVVDGIEGALDAVLGG